MKREKLQKNFNQLLVKKFTNKSIAVTGSGGFIAKHLIKKLKDLKINKLKIIPINSNNRNMIDGFIVSLNSVLTLCWLLIFCVTGNNNGFSIT